MADSFRQFLNEIGKHPLLTAEQEIQLSRRIFAMQDLLAERDLEKTKIKSPYDSKIEKTNVELGSLISQGSVVGSVYSADRFELRLPVSINEYDFVDIHLNQMKKNGVESNIATYGILINQNAENR